MTDTSLVESSSPATGVQVVAFNRPEKRNALSKQLITVFLAELARASADPEIKAIIVTGKGPLFSGTYLFYSVATLAVLFPLIKRYVGPGPSSGF